MIIDMVIEIWTKNEFLNLTQKNFLLLEIWIFSDVDICGLVDKKDIFSQISKKVHFP